MKWNKTATAITAAVALAALATPLSATADDGPNPAAPIGAQQARTYEAEARAFFDAHPVPVNTPGSPEADYEQFKVNIAAYWREAPWTAIYGQWGCTVSSVDVSEQVTGDGEIIPVVTSVSSCGEDGVASELASTLATRSEVLQEPAPTSLCGSPSYYSFYQCIGSAGVGIIRATAKNMNLFTMNSIRVRLGQVAGTACVAGTQRAISAYRNVGRLETIQVQAPTNVSTNWSNSINASGDISVGRMCARY